MAVMIQALLLGLGRRRLLLLRTAFDRRFTCPPFAAAITFSCTKFAINRPKKTKMLLIFATNGRKLY